MLWQKRDCCVSGLGVERVEVDFDERREAFRPQSLGSSRSG
jgi:hypothetical protein